MTDTAKRNRALLGAAIGVLVLVASCCCCSGLVGTMFREDLALAWHDALYEYVDSGSASPGFPVHHRSETAAPIRRLISACAGTGPLELRVVDSLSGRSETITGVCRDWASSYHDLADPSFSIEVTVVRPADRVEISSYR